ncbi:MAG: MerR family transcriptional regulator [Bacteroidota bacterium]
MAVEMDEDGTPKFEFTINKLFWNITEVAEMFNVNASLIRLWERQFDILKPRRINTRGDRKYNKKDLENFKLVYHIIREKGYSIPGAQQKLREMNEKPASSSEVLLTLRKIKDFLLELRSQL